MTGGERGRGDLILSLSHNHPNYRIFIFFFFSLLVFLLSFSCEVITRAAADKPAEGKIRSSSSRIYVVYMGAASAPTDKDYYAFTNQREDHLLLLASALNRNIEHIADTRLLVRSYRHGFSGFSARLSKQEALTISTVPGVVSVFADPLFQLHTTRSWDFLQYQTDLEIDQYSSGYSRNKNPHGTSGTGTDDDETETDTDTIIGILDTGIWPESQSFKDNGMGPVPSRWRGVCMQGHDFLASNCNRKLIGARYYNDSDSDPSSASSEHSTLESDQTPRDTVGHGTHTASTAAGSPVSDASYYNGLAAGTAKGGSPGSRIAVYRVCTSNGCRGSSILAAFDDAIGDGVDVLSLSLGASAFLRPDFSSDPVAIGAFHAVQKGITVVCSAGNEGPSSSTVVNAAPWILTVAATTIDRDFESDVVLGGNKGTVVVKGEAINFSTLHKSPIYPLIHASSAKSNSSSEDDARNCNPDSLDGKNVKGKIVLCEHTDQSYSKREKMEGLKEIGGIGLVLIDDIERAVAFPYGAFPMTVVSSREASDILSYINSTRNAVATILPTVAVTKYKPAPSVAYFSSRGPSVQTRNLLKPDIAAPGVNILAAWLENNDTSEAPAGQKPSKFNLLSGTSMSCPHVSGIAATIKSRNPSWSPSAIRSAIMTTASQSNNEKALLTADSGSTATPYDYGAGEVSPSGALQPGLVYEVHTDDYLQFLCNYGYKVSDIKLISNVSDGFYCPKNSSKDLISELNYPSISISKFTGKDSKKVGRTVTNVGAEDETIYSATVNSPRELDVKVVPNRLQFTKNSKMLSYQVTFSAVPSSKVITDIFGSITWSNGKYKVRTPFVVTAS